MHFALSNCYIISRFASPATPFLLPPCRLNAEFSAQLIPESDNSSCCKRHILCNIQQAMIKSGIMSSFHI